MACKKPLTVKALEISAIILVIVNSQPVHANDGLDDKALHAIVGAALGTGYLLAPNEAPEHAYLLTLGVALTLIIGKEVYDALGHGTPELADVGAGWVPAIATASLLFIIEVEGDVRLRLLAPRPDTVGVSATWQF